MYIYYLGPFKKKKTIKLPTARYYCLLTYNLPNILFKHYFYYVIKIIQCFNLFCILFLQEISGQW